MWLDLDDRPAFFFKEEKMSKIIFVDIDGVLVTERSAKIGRSQHGYDGFFDPIGIKMLNQLAADFNAKFVFSTSWRNTYQDTLIHVLNVAGLHTSYTYQIDIYKGSKDTPPYFTPKGNTRHDEIQGWIDQHKPLNFVIFDDVIIKKPISNHWVQTSPDDGISYKMYQRARSILGADKWVPANAKKSDL